MSNLQSQCLSGLDVNRWNQVGLLVNTCRLHEFLSSYLVLNMDSPFEPRSVIVMQVRLSPFLHSDPSRLMNSKAILVPMTESGGSRGRPGKESGNSKDQRLSKRV
jgi:hypothetical protein